MSKHQEPKFNKNLIRAIIGLGNPGQRYYKTRHNIGFRVVDELAGQFYVSDWQRNDVMEYTQRKLVADDGQPVYMIKPQTFMNSSGKVISFLTKKGIKPDEIVVVHDELEKPFGHLSLRLGGSAKGHNGLRSIIEQIGADFWRLRFGIGRPERKEDVGDYVLRAFTPQEEDQLITLIPGAVGLLAH
jgi:PTH1 family peptidyl-tRNA hydrolase